MESPARGHRAAPWRSASPNHGAGRPPAATGRSARITLARRDDARWSIQRLGSPMGTTRCEWMDHRHPHHSPTLDCDRSPSRDTGRRLPPGTTLHRHRHRGGEIARVGRTAIDKGAGATDADRQRPCGKRTAREHRRAVMDGPTQVIRDLAALARRAPRNRDREFVAAVATSDGARRQSLADDAADRAHGFGAGQMPVLVVQRLQAIHVKYEQCRLGRAPAVKRPPSTPDVLRMNAGCVDRSNRRSRRAADDGRYHVSASP